MNLKLTINDVEISNGDILDRVEFITDMGTQDFTVGKFITPTTKITLHENVSIKTGDIVKIYINDTQYFIGEPYEIKQGQMSRQITLYAMPYFLLTKTFTPSTTNYTTRSLLLEMQTNIGFTVANFDSISVIDMNDVKADTGINLLQSIAMLLGVNCFITEHGEILFKLIGNDTVQYNLTTRNGEYIQTLANEDLIVVDTDVHGIVQSQITSIVKSDTTDYLITRIIGKLSDSDENPIIVGTQANSWNDLTLINPYLTESICTSILGKLPNYTGFDLTIFNAPLIKPLDKVTFTYKGIEYTIPVMNLTLTYATGGLVAKVQSCVSTAQDKTSNYKGSFTSKLEVIKNVQSELNTKVEVIDGQVTTLITNTTIIDGDGNEVTVRDAYSQIQQDLGNIDLTVGEAVSNINVGGENLILNSNWEKGLDANWSSSRCFEIDASDSSLKYVYTEDSTITERYKYSDAISLGGLQGRDLAFSCEYWVHTATTRPIARISFFELEEEFEVADCVSIEDVVVYSSDMVLSAWNRVCHVVTVPENANFVRVSVCSPSNETIWWRRLQLQLGSVATDWHPSPYDIGQDVDDLKGQVQANTESIASLQINADNISATVKEIQTNTEEALETVGSDIATLTQQVQASMTSEDVSILIQQEMSNGVNSVTTETGYKFDKDGLTISKTGNEMSTKVDEDGLTIYKNGSEVMLDVSNQGVEAKNINVSTYLIVGNNSRFENYGSNRTGCFFIGDSE